MMTAAALGAVLVALPGCQLAGALAVLLPAPKKTVKAEYPYMNNEKLCILVNAEMETLFDFPHVQYELSEYISREVEKNVKGATVVSPRTIDELQRRDSRWSMRDPARIGAQFGATKVMVIDLTQYATREADSPHLYRGRVSANIRVYDADYFDHQPTFTASIDTVWPTDSPAGAWGIDDAEVRDATMRQFADELVGRFYDRRVELH
ncbi:MAG: hypothetical protein KDA32_11395 [Phycisphaerales bacterium]|nr:hypothetical protein [Phycisphaerales bacterium]